MIRYLGAAIVIAIAFGYAYYQNTRCEAAGGVMLRSNFESVCVRNLEIIR